MEVNIYNAEDFIAKCTDYADSIDTDNMDDSTMQLVADVYRLAELSLALHKKLVYIKEQLESIEGTQE